MSTRSFRNLAVVAAVGVVALTGCAVAQQSPRAASGQTSPATPQAPATPQQTTPATQQTASGTRQAAPQQAASQALPAAPVRTPDVHFVPTPHETVKAMLDVAKVGPQDVVYDLGSGDGRIAIAAAKRGARATGIDIDPKRIAEARENAERERVTDRVRFVLGDLFEQDFSDATVITLYLLPSLNLKLRPTLMQLRPGTRIVSHNFDMGDWKPEQTLQVGGSTVYYWTVPGPGARSAQAGGTR